MAAPPAARPLEGLLAEAGRLLASSLELEDTLRIVARLAVPEFADWAAVDLVEPSGALRQHSSGHDDPRKDELMLAMRRRLRAQIAAGTRPVDGVSLSVQTGEPAVVQVSGIDPSLLEGEEEHRLMAELHPTSYLIAPLRTRDRVIGALTLVSTDPGRLYDEGDLPVALELADRCAQAVDNAQRYDEAQSARALLDVVFATAPVGLALLDADLRLVLLNDRMAAINGRPVQEQLGRTMSEAIGPLAEVPEALSRQVLESGVARSDVEILGDDRAFLGSYAPVTVDDRVLGVICAVVETTERHRAHERASRLQGVAEQLSATLRNDEVADVILRAGMEATGGSCAVLGLLDGDELSIGHRIGMEGGKAPSLLPLAAEAPMPAAVRAGAPVLLGSREAWLERFPAVPPRGDFEAFAAVPLLFEGGAAGAMGIGFPRRRGFDAVDVEMLLAIARQGAQALERARLYEERAYVARTLQEGLLPRELPEIPGLDVAVLYRPIGGGGQVGGDFYDLFDVAEGCWLVAVGDVCGKGSEAAVQAGVVRNTIRALAVRESDPAEILRGVNEALLREPSAQALSTAACGTVGRRDDGAFWVTLSGGGHPPALVLREGGGVEAIETRGPMLGVQHDPELVEAEVALAPGDLLLLYTDGVIDARRGREVFGEERLRNALASAAGGDAAGALEAIDTAVREFHPGRPRDDKALLAIRVVP